MRYAYVFKDTQPEFVSALSAGEGSPLEPLLHIVIIWRRDANHLKYEWLPNGWVDAAQDERVWNETRRHLEKTIKKLLRATEALPYAAVIGELADEHAQVHILFSDLDDEIPTFYCSICILDLCSFGCTLVLYLDTSICRSYILS